MKTKTKLIFTTLFGVVIGLVLGAFVTFHYVTLFYMDGFYTQEIGRSTVNVSSLINIREGNIDKAIKMLEMDIDASATTLREPDIDVSETTKDFIEKSLSYIDGYKTKYNVKK